MDVRILIATHKEYVLPKNEIYLPIFVGSACSSLDLPYQRDDEGDNISRKNPYYCELTGIYWAYRNLKADYVGLFHYRRYLKLDGIDIGRYDVILPKKRHYYIETVYDQFQHAHGSAGLDIAREVISRDHPEYLKTFDRCMKRRSLHLFNMFVMKYDTFIAYCDFLFDVLFKIEEKLGEEDRLYGFIAERLMDVYLEKEKLKCRETQTINTEPINWPKKIIAFIRRKYA